MVGIQASKGMHVHMVKFDLLNTLFDHNLAR